MKKYSRIISVIISIHIMFNMSIFTIHANNMASQSAVEEVRLLGVEIPSEIQSLNNLESILEHLLNMAKEGMHPTYNYHLMEVLYNDIYDAMNLTQNYTKQIFSSSSEYFLIDSSWDTVWNNTFDSYNCYAYALDRPQDNLTYPGFYSKRPFQ